MNDTIPPLASGPMAITYTLEARDIKAFFGYARKHLPGLKELRYVLLLMVFVLIFILITASSAHVVPKRAFAAPAAAKQFFQRAVELHAMATQAGSAPCGLDK